VGDDTGRKLSVHRLLVENARIDVQKLHGFSILLNSDFLCGRMVMSLASLLAVMLTVCIQALCLPFHDPSITFSLSLL
jgi:hypothetical protein